MDSYDRVYAQMKSLLGIPTPPMPDIPIKELTEEKQLQQFIKDYIDEPPPLPRWQNLFAKQLAYSQMYSGRGYGKAFGYHRKFVILDECMPINEKPTFKPTKKQAKLLKKFRKLKRFK